MNYNEPGALLTVDDAAILLNVSTATVRKALAGGQLPCLTLGKRRLIPRKLFLDWLALKPVLQPAAEPGPSREELLKIAADAADKAIEQRFAKKVPA